MIIKAWHRKLQSKTVDIIFQFLELVFDIWVRAKDILKILHLATCKHKKALNFRPRKPNRILQFLADALELAHIWNYAVQYKHIIQTYQD